MITLLAFGSRGDVQPYIALGAALYNAGQKVRLVTFANFESLVTSRGLEFYGIEGDVTLAASRLVAQGVTTPDNPLKVFLSFGQLKKLIFDLQSVLFHACSGADAIVYHPGATIGYFAAQHLDIPAILATPFPMRPTRAYPSLLFYDRPRLGKGYNYLTHKIFEGIMWSASKDPVRKFLKQEFGQVPVGFGCPFPRQSTSRHPTVISCSPQVFPLPEDWPANIHCAGYWFLEDEEDWMPPDYLQSFLAAGPAPVYVGFGSVGDARIAAQTTALVIEALRLSGQRGVLATGWQGMAAAEQLPETICMLESAPHGWLFPRMAAVVHHGGAGTTAAGLRAGVPAAIIPHGNDQFAWGRRVYELGVGAKPVPKKRLTAENLADAIRFALREEVKTKARHLGEKINAERGAAAAASVILDCLG